MIEIIFDYRKISYIFCIYQFVIVNLNLFYSPSNLIFLLWFQFLIISFGKKIFCHSFVCLISFPEAFIIQPVQRQLFKQHRKIKRKRIAYSLQFKVFLTPVFFSHHFFLSFSHLKQLLLLNRTVLIKASLRFHQLSSVFLFFKPMLYSPPLNS